jgi:hypothetical protein
MSPAMLQLIVFAVKEAVELYPSIAQLIQAVVDKREVTPTMWAQAHAELAGLTINLPTISAQAEVFTGKIS